MSESHASSESPPQREHRATGWMAVVLLLATIGGYANSLHVPFVYDDVQAITENESLRSLWPLSRVLLPLNERGLTVSGRPVLNFSLALNYAISGTSVWSYHVFNVLIHAGAGLLLFGIVRRTLSREELATPAPGGWRGLSSSRGAGANRRGDRSLHLAFVVAAIWLLHPLQTQAVTYTVQRAESLMGFFYLLTLYAFIRWVEDPAAIGWKWMSFAACALGMGTKEVMATAPLAVLLFDRAFVAGSFRVAWRERGRFHLLLVSTWLVLAALLASTGGNRGGTVGIGTGVPLWAYPLTQFEALARYLGLGMWPHPLVFEYGTFWVRRPAECAPYLAIIATLLLATIVALVRAPKLGFLGAWFFLILAPTSLAPGTIQMIVEHRMYLPLAAIAVAAVMAAQAYAGRRTLLATVLVALAGGVLTVRRNLDYRSHLALWSDTVAKRPNNARAHQGLGEALAELGRDHAAADEFLAAVRLQPDEARHHYNLAFALAKLGRYEQAIARYEESLRLAPNEPRTHNNLAIALSRAGRNEEALARYQAAQQLAPRDAQYPFNHGLALFRMDRIAEAVAQYEAALRLRPDYADAHFNLAAALVRSGQLDRALTHYAEAARLAPSDAEIHASFGSALLLARRADEALWQFRAARQCDPRNTDARFGEANALAALRRVDEAVPAYESLLRDQPQHADAHFKLANLLFDVNRVAAAATHYEAALHLNPNDSEAHHNLGISYARMERWEEAGREFETALRLKPDYPDAQRHLEQLRSLRGR